LKLSAPAGFPTVALNYDVNSAFLNLTDEENILNSNINAQNATIDLKNATILGWGITEQGLAQALRQGTVPLVPRDECAQVDAFLSAGAPITSTMICAGQVPKRVGQVWPHLPPVDACQGDSGGPLLSVAPTTSSSSLARSGEAVDTSGDVQYGIVSFGVGCAQPGVPGVYTDISKVKDFIEETLKKFEDSS
jgi:secreted trypsin-like serine protease